jgi:hypothetical protein
MIILYTATYAIPLAFCALYGMSLIESRTSTPLFLALDQIVVGRVRVQWLCRGRPATYMHQSPLFSLSLPSCVCPRADRGGITP